MQILKQHRTLKWSLSRSQWVMHSHLGYFISSGTLASAFWKIMVTHTQWNIWRVVIQITASFGSIKKNKKTDIHTVNTAQIIPFNIGGSWNMTKRVMIFHLHEIIGVLFDSFYWNVNSVWRCIILPISYFWHWIYTFIFMQRLIKVIHIFYKKF